MMTLVIDNWPIFLGVGLIAIVLAIVMRVRGARRRVDIARPTLDDAPLAPTLARPVAVAAPPPPVPESASALTQIKGLGPRLATTLAALGVTRLDQIAAWTPADLAAIDAQLGSFRGRPKRDQWIAQARLLADGDLSTYESRFGKTDGTA